MATIENYICQYIDESGYLRMCLSGSVFDDDALSIDGNVVGDNYWEIKKYFNEFK